jgi:hypothetical protein
VRSFPLLFLPFVPNVTLFPRRNSLRLHGKLSVTSRRVQTSLPSLNAATLLDTLSKPFPFLRPIFDNPSPLTLTFSPMHLSPPTSASPFLCSFPLPRFDALLRLVGTCLNPLDFSPSFGTSILPQASPGLRRARLPPPFFSMFGAEPHVGSKIRS